MTVYDDFRIQFIEKDGTKTHFAFQNNESINELILEQLAKVFCLFTLCVFQTDSEERQIVFKKGDTFCCEKIDDLCKHYFEKTQSTNIVDFPKNTTFFSYDEDDKMFGYKHFNDSLDNISEIQWSQIYTKKKESEFESQSESDSDSESESDKKSNASVDIKTVLNYYPDQFYDQFYVNPGIKLEIEQSNYESKAMTCLDDDQKFWHFDYHKSLLVNKIYDIDDEVVEDMGNYGQYVEYKSEQYKGRKLQERYSIFDFDQLEIHANKIMDSPQHLRYVCTFTPIRGIHHAASMFAQSCMVNYTVTDVRLQSINSVIVDFKLHDRVYNVTTVYLGIDVL